MSLDAEYWVSDDLELREDSFLEGEIISSSELTIEERVYAVEQACVWRTVRGRRVCIREGESAAQAVKRSIAERTTRAQHSYNPATKEKQQRAARYEATVAELIGGKNLDDNEPFDVVKGKHAVEIKTVLPGAKAVKITMHPDSLARKATFLREERMVGHTVVIDARTSTTQYYYARGVGSFRLSAMQRVHETELRGLVGGDYAEWDPSEHPREPAGSSKGGQWQSIGSGLGGGKVIATVSDKFRPGAFDPAKYQRAVQKALDRIPEELRLVPQQKVVVSGVRRDDNTLGSFTPVSESANTGYIHVFPLQRMMTAPAIFGENIIAHSAVHEYGHAVDRYYSAQSGRWLSNNSQFTEAFQKDVSGMTPAMKRDLTHYVSNHKEAFAESYAHLAMKLSGAVPRARFEKAFPNVLTYMRTQLISDVTARGGKHFSVDEAYMIRTPITLSDGRSAVLISGFDGVGSFWDGLEIEQPNELEDIDL